MNIVFHGSSVGNLKSIRPRMSTHGKNYVYASKYRLVSLLFLSRWNDFLLTLNSHSTADVLNLTLIERYPNALEEIFRNKSGFIYSLSAENFFFEPECWELELVSPNEEKVITGEHIVDILDEIKNYKQLGAIKTYRYPDRPEMVPDDDSDMVDKAIALYESSGNLYNAIYCAERFPHLYNSLHTAFENRFGLSIDKPYADN